MVRTVGVGSFTLTVTAIAPGTTTSVSGTKSSYAERTLASVTVTRLVGTDTLTMGDSTKLSVVAHDGLGAVYPAAIISWRVTDTAAASISSSGVLLARAMGRDTVVATAIGPAAAVHGTVTGRVGVTVRLAFTRIEAGTEHTCGIARGGSIYCWGEGALRRLGDGVNYPVWTSVAHPVRVLSSANFTSLSLDEQADSKSGHTCATTTDAALYCWGSGSWGMLGDGADGQGWPPHLSTIPLHVGSGSFVDVALGGAETCGLTMDGTAYVHSPPLATRTVGALIRRANWASRHRKAATGMQRTASFAQRNPFSRLGFRSSLVSPRVPHIPAGWWRTVRFIAGVQTTADSSITALRWRRP